MIMDVEIALPEMDDVGESGTWTLPVSEGTVAPTGSMTVDAEFLGLSSSYQPGHSRRGLSNHPHSDYAPRKIRCSTCRWFEARIFRETGGARRYLVYSAGRSIVPGEGTRVRHEWCRNASEVLEAMVTREPGEMPHFTVPASRVLGQAAGFDDDLQDAWENRAVL